MTASLRLGFAIVCVCVLPTISLAQVGHRVHRLFAGSNPTPTEISNHLRGYYAGNHNHGGNGYGGGAGYGYSGGSGPTYGGGFFFPGYGNTYGFYPYGSGYNYSSPNFAPPPALASPNIISSSSPLDAATGLPLAPQTLPNVRSTPLPIAP